MINTLRSLSPSSGTGKRGAVKGSTWKAHKYIARVPLGNDTWRYFYTQQQIAAYKAERRKNKGIGGKVEMLRKKKKGKKTLKQIRSDLDKILQRLGEKSVKKSTEDAKKKTSDKSKENSTQSRSSSTSRGSSSRSSSLISGYTAGGGKPKGMSDYLWEQYQKAWNTTVTSTAPNRNQVDKKKDEMQKKKAEGQKASGSSGRTSKERSKAQVSDQAKTRLERKMFENTLRTWRDAKQDSYQVKRVSSPPTISQQQKEKAARAVSRTDLVDLRGITRNANREIIDRQLARLRRKRR